MEDTKEKAYELGRQYEKEYRGCGQCVIAALFDALKIKNDSVFKSATGLAGGGGITGDGSCGAYVGGIMVLGILLGRERSDFTDSAKVSQKNFQLVKKLRDKFIAEYGAVVCRDIQRKIYGRSFYIADPDEYQKFEKAGAHEKHCLEIVGKAARWTLEIIEEAKIRIE